MRNFTKDQLYNLVRHVLNHAQIEAHIAHLDHDDERFEIYRGFCQTIYEIRDQIEAEGDSTI